ncbi:MAG: hypothetical protein ACI3ZC_05020 [Candidatus Cryptobacteroides sp.]
MNILVKTYSGHIVSRPDTTWEKDNEDFFPPDFVGRLDFSPVLFARVCKPGRCVGARFTSRYYDSVNYGILLYPADHMYEGPECYAEALTLDHTSFLPAPLSSAGELSGIDFSLQKNGTGVFSTRMSSSEISGMIEKALIEVTSRIYIRTGDLIAIELAPVSHLASRPEGNFGISGTLDGQPFMSFNVHNI